MFKVYNLFGSFLIPESLRWLAKVGKEKEFEVALQKLRGNDADISEEAAEIQEYMETFEHLPKAKMLDLFQRRYWFSLIVGVGLMVFQQFGGINGVCFYFSYVFDSAELLILGSNGTNVRVADPWKQWSLARYNQDKNS